MAKKPGDAPAAPAPEPDLLDSAEATVEAERSAAANPAAPPDVRSLGQTWLDRQVGIETAEADFHSAMRAVKVTASKPVNITGRRFFPGAKGRVKEARDFT